MYLKRRLERLLYPAGVLPPGKSAKRISKFLKVCKPLSWRRLHLIKRAYTEDEEFPGGDDGDDGDDEPINPLVDALFDEIEELRTQVRNRIHLFHSGLTYERKLFEAQLRCATIEAETREEMAKDFGERTKAMERAHTQRLMREVSSRKLVTPRETITANRSN